MKRYILWKAAERNLDWTKTYLTQEAGPSVAKRVLRELRDAMRLLGSRPQIGHVREDLIDERLRFWPAYSYLIIYDSAPKPIEIVRIAHGARDVPTLLG